MRLMKISVRLVFILVLVLVTVMRYELIAQESRGFNHLSHGKLISLPYAVKGNNKKINSKPRLLHSSSKSQGRKLSTDVFLEFQKSNLVKVSSSKRPIQVYLPSLRFFHQKFVVHEFKHFILDGIMQSPFLNLTIRKDNADVLLAQTSLEFSVRKWCRRFAPYLHDFMESRPKLFTAKPILLMDWQDDVQLSPCFGLKHERALILYTKRSIVRGRRYVKENHQIEIGRIEPYSNWSEVADSPIRHTPYAVRSDIVRALEDELLREHRSPTRISQTRNSSLLHWNVVERNRTQDVAHFWPRNGEGVDNGGKYPNSLLRNSVSQTLEELSRNCSSSFFLKVFTGLAGKAHLEGRFSVDPAYAKALLDFKIIVVAQKDTHEDHYRLMEALVSGAMVMTDVMLSIPRDFVDGESIVFYRNMDELQTKILYYLGNNKKRLSIAKMGWTIAMHRHRSWHRMEEILLGKILSPPLV
jgi:Glycosyl transferases group 1